MNNKLTKYTAVFIYDDKVYIYKIGVKIDAVLNKYGIFRHVSSAGEKAFSKFIKENEIKLDLEIIFLLFGKNNIQAFIGCKSLIELINLEINGKNITTSDTFNIIPHHYRTIYNNEPICGHILILNNPAYVDVIPENITELYVICNKKSKLISDNDTNFLDNLPISIEKLYLFYPIKKPIANLPPSVNKIYVSSEYDINITKIPFGCEIIKVNI
jgi:hypothetical protein